MNELLPVVNKLYDIFTTIGSNPYILDLPQIVVVGSQSSGKSSVLESIVGRDFLPRGNGICTRRPLLLSLINVKGTEDYAVFQHKPTVQFKDFNAVKTEIINETNREIGEGNGVSPNPIRLKFFSEKMINLNLVDLPGITKVAADDQPSDIEKKITKIVKKYASNPNSVILAIIPANADIATSDALQIAKSVDPRSERTIGVLTKVDLMDKGESVSKILDGKVFPLKYGYIAVKNRSQMEITNNLSIEQNLKNECDFFSSSAFYKSRLGKTGIAVLRRRLNEILFVHIKANLPKVKFQVKKAINVIEKEIETYGGHIKDVNSQAAAMLSILSKFTLSFNNAIEGKEKNSMATRELYGGALISKIFHQIFAANILNIDPFLNLSDVEIGNAIKNATGTKPSLFVPEMSFEILSKTQIARLKEPSLDCVDMVYNELVNVSRSCNTKELKRFSKLQDRIVDCVSDVLRENKHPATKMVEFLIDIELAYINTNHPDFIGGSNAVPSALEKVQKDNLRRNKAASQPSEGDESNKDEEKLDLSVPKSREDILKTINLFKNQKRAGNRKHPETSGEGKINRRDRLNVEIEIIKSLMISYYKIVRKNVLDAVPKAIMHFLVNKTKEELQSKLVSALYKSEMFEGLLEENREVFSERKRNVDLLNVLRKAVDVLDGIREFKVGD